jgi:fluoride exporter
MAKLCAATPGKHRRWNTIHRLFWSSQFGETKVMSLNSCLWIVLGGAIGTFSRYLISMLALPISRELPWGTIAINIAGSFIIGFVGTLTLTSGRFPISENMRLFIMVGFCGGFTTFSSFSLQTLDLLRSGAIARAAINVALSVLLCVGAVALGHVLAAHFNGGAAAVAQLSIEEEA